MCPSHFPSLHTPFFFEEWRTPLLKREGHKQKGSVVPPLASLCSFPLRSYAPTNTFRLSLRQHTTLPTASYVFFVMKALAGFPQADNASVQCCLSTNTEHFPI